MSKKKSAQSPDKKSRQGAMIPSSPPLIEMPEEYAGFLADLKERITHERIRAVLSANAAMVLLYWDIGHAILARQEQEGWGAKVIDRLSLDLKIAFPDMSGLSARNLKYMRRFAAAWPDRAIVQEALARIPWYHNLALLEKADMPEQRNIGLFDSVDSAANIPLARLVLTYAENGRGKTTLTADLRSLATGDPIPITERRRLAAQYPPHVVLDCDGGPPDAMFENGAWNRTLSVH